MKKLKFLALVIVLFILTKGLNAQNVGTLITDSSKNFEAINWLDDGRIYVADYNNGRLYRVYIDGRVETIVTGFGNIAGGGVDQKGNFYFSGISNGTVNLLNDDGTFTQVASGFNQPVGILPGETEDEIIVAAYGSSSVSKVTISTGAVEVIASGQGISGPDGIVFNASGEILVSNFNNNLIHKIDSANVVSLWATLPEEGFMGYIAKYEDEYYVPSIGAKKIYKINEDGDVTFFAGSGVEGLEDGNANDASFELPNGIAISPNGDTILISDGSTIRIITDFGVASGVMKSNIFTDFSYGPNPCVDKLNITYDNTKGSLNSWQVFNHSGQVMKSDSIIYSGNISIETKDLLPGIYSVSLYAEEESKVFQFIKI